MLGLGLGTKAQSGLRAYGPDPEGWAEILEDRSEFYEGDTVSILNDIDDRVGLDKTSVIITPNGYSRGFIHGVKPTTAPFSDLDFTRPSIGTRVNSQGQIEERENNVPRIDYVSTPFALGVDGRGFSLGGEQEVILIEPERTNVNINSQDMSGYQQNTGITIEENAAIAPDGTMTATRVNGIQSIVGNRFETRPTSNITGGLTYTGSAYVKGEGASIGQTASLQIKRVGGASSQSTVTVTLTDQWQRIEVPNTFQADNTGCTLIIENTGGGSTADSYLYWGAQIEEGEYATSYIKTEGTTQTRGDERAPAGAGDLSNDINSQEGVLYMETSTLYDDTSIRRSIGVSNGTINERAYMRYHTTSNQIRGLYVTGNVTVAQLIHTLPDSTEFIRAAFKWKENDFALWINGVEVATENTGGVSAAKTMDRIHFSDGNVEFFYGRCRVVTVFDRALTDTELGNLTSL